MSNRYWAGFKNGKICNETVDSDDGYFEVPALYKSKEIAQREGMMSHKFDEIRLVEVVEVKK